MFLNPKEIYRDQLRTALLQKWACENGPYNSFMALVPRENKKSDDKENTLFGNLLHCPLDFLKQRQSWQYTTLLNISFKNILTNAAKTEKDPDKKKFFAEVLKGNEEFPRPMPMVDDTAPGEATAGKMSSYGPPPPAPKKIISGK